MEILVLGSGTAFNLDGRGSPAFLMRRGAAPPFLVDVGPTALVAAERFAAGDWPALDELFVTHLHGDHTAGWPFLLLHLVFLHRRARPLHVWGPPGTGACLRGLGELCYGDALEERAFEVVFHELPVAPAEGLRGADGMRFDVLPMEHHATSLGYRFEVDGAGVGVTGDTAWCEGLEHLARRSDVLLLECTGVTAVPGAHLALDQVRAGIERLGRGQLLLVHLTDEVAAELARDPIPRVLATYDGFVFS